MKFFLTAIFLVFTLSVFSQKDKDLPEPKSPPQLVTDFTSTLTEAQRLALENKLVAYDDSTSNQIAVVIIKSLEGFDIADYAIALFRKWGIGNKKSNNGILVLVAKDDRKMRIEVGYGLEGAVPDITAKHIIDETITPAFKEDNYYRGLDLGTDYIIKAAAGEFKAPANYGKKKTGTKAFGSILGLLILLLIISSMGGRGSGGTMSGAGWIIGTLLNSAGRSSGGWGGGGGGGWSGGGGGGFGGFGGGSSGGGGASGSW